MRKSTADIEREMNRDLLSCSTNAIAAWTLLRFQMEFESERFGYLQRNGRPVPQERIARLANCSPAEGDHTLQELIDVGLISTAGGTWFSPALARIETVRAGSRTRARKSRERGRGARAPAVTTHVARSVRPKCSEPLLTLLPGEKEEIAAQSKPAAAKKRKKSSRTRTPDEHACWKKFIDVWCNVIWPGVFEGEVYDMMRGSSDDGGNRNYRAVWGILDHVGMDFDKAIEAAKCFARTFRDSAWRFPCPLNILRRDMLKWVNFSKLQSGDRHGTGFNTARSGEFADNLPTGRRAYPGEGAGVAAAG